METNQSAEVKKKRINPILHFIKGMLFNRRYFRYLSIMIILAEFILGLLIIRFVPCILIIVYYIFRY